MASDSPEAPLALTLSDLLDRLQLDAIPGATAPGQFRDQEVWRQIDGHVRRYARIVVNQLALKGDEDEIVQEVLLRMQSPAVLQRMKAAGSPEGYLFVMVRNQAVSTARRRGRARSLLRAFRSETLRSLHAAGTDEPERLDALRHELRRLTQEEKHLLRMRFWKGLSIAEIARQQNAPYSRTAVKIFRLLRRLLARLDVS